MHVRNETRVLLQTPPNERAGASRSSLRKQHLKITELWRCTRIENTSTNPHLKQMHLGTVNRSLFQKNTTLEMGLRTWLDASKFKLLVSNFHCRLGYCRPCWGALGWFETHCVMTMPNHFRGLWTVYLRSWIFTVVICILHRQTWALVMFFDYACSPMIWQ